MGLSGAALACRCRHPLLAALPITGFNFLCAVCSIELSLGTRALAWHNRACLWIVLLCRMEGLSQAARVWSHHLNPRPCLPRFLAFNRVGTDFGDRARLFHTRLFCVSE